VRECFSCEVRQAMDAIYTMPPDQGGQEGAATSSDRKEVTSDSGDFMARLMYYSKAMLLSAVFLLLVLFGSVSASLAAAPEGATLVRSASSSDIVKILSVMESRTTDRSILDKAAGKLNAMEGRNLRILSSLCDRIVEDADAPGADIAFSLMTVMIVLS
jgi:hypothetical protein